MAEIKNVLLGSTQVNKIFSGIDLIYEKAVVDIVAPITTPRPAEGTFATAQTIWLDVNEPGTTYYTTNGTTPTIASPKYIDGILINATTTLKYFTVDLKGNAEAIKTSVYTINSGWRYLKIQGYGTSADLTTRLIEFEAWEGATNRMLAATILSNDVINAGSTDVNTIKNGTKVTTSNTYPIWWVAVPNANIVIDLGLGRLLTKLNYFGYSLTGDQRQNRFKVLASNTNNGSDWVTLWDMSTNITPQPILPLGYEVTL